MSNNTTLKKISQILDISISTVSRALKDHPDISAKTKQKVTELANALEYEPNAYAINLRTNNSKIFGLIVPDISYYFYNTFISSVEEECRKNNYSLLILQSGDNPETESANIKLCRQNRVSGVFACITSSTANIEAFYKLKEADIPLIFFDKVPADNSFSKVCIADTEAARLAAEFIVQKQKNNVLGLFGNTSLSITQKRLSSFKEVFAENAAINLVIAHAISFDDAYEKCLACLNTHIPDTIFCMSDEILIGAMRAVQEKRLHIPKDVSVIALSNGFMPLLYVPQITYVETSGYQLGKLAFKNMMDSVAGNTVESEVFVPCRLVEGASF